MRLIAVLALAGAVSAAAYPGNWNEWKTETVTTTCYETTTVYKWQTETETETVTEYKKIWVPPVTVTETCTETVTEWEKCQQTWGEWN